MKGTTSITSQTGCVQACSRLIADTPCVTSGMTASEQNR